MPEELAYDNADYLASMGKHETCTRDKGYEIVTPANKSQGEQRAPVPRPLSSRV